MHTPLQSQASISPVPYTSPPTKRALLVAPFELTSIGQHSTGVTNRNTTYTELISQPRFMKVRTRRGAHLSCEYLLCTEPWQRRRNPERNPAPATANTGLGRGTAEPEPSPKPAVRRQPLLTGERALAAASSDMVISER